MKVSVEGMVIVICVSVGIFFLLVLSGILIWLQRKNNKKIEVLEEELEEEHKHEKELEDIIKEEQAHHHPHHQPTNSMTEMTTQQAIVDDGKVESTPEPVRHVCEGCNRPFSRP